MRRFASCAAGAMILALAALVSCGPKINGATQRPHAVTIIHNNTSSLEHMTVRWAVGGAYVGQAERLVEPHGYCVVVMGEQLPELVEVDTVAWKAAWSPIEWGSKLRLHVDFPAPQVRGE